MPAVVRRRGDVLLVHCPRSIKMSSESSPQMRKLSDFTRTFPQNDELKEAIAAFSTGSDGSAVLLAGAWLDNYLANLIIQNFKRKIDDGERKDLFEQSSSPFHTLNAKLRLARASDLISELIYNQIIEISYVRNVFAHSPYSITCNTPEIALRCSRLDFLQLQDHFLTITGSQFPDVSLVRVNPSSSPRFIIIACSLLILGIIQSYTAERLNNIINKAAMLEAILYARICEMEYVTETNNNNYFKPIPDRSYMLEDLREKYPDMFQIRSV